MRWDEWAAVHPGAFPETPWLGPEAIEFFQGILRPGFRVLEHGAGGSTIWLARRVAWLTSMEHDPSWLAAVERALVESGLRHKAAVVRVPIAQEPDFKDRAGAAIASGRRWDLVYVDGHVSGRAFVIELGAQQLRPGGWMVIDNVGGRDGDPDYWERTYGVADALRRLDGWERTDIQAWVDGKHNATAFCRKPA